jgi:hypothetical protein
MAILKQLKNQTFQEGLAMGVRMSDAEVITYYNGVTTMLNSSLWQHPGRERWPLAENIEAARKGLGDRLDALGQLGVVALVGHFGAPEFRPLCNWID